MYLPSTDQNEHEDLVDRRDSFDVFNALVADNAKEGPVVSRDCLDWPNDKGFETATEYRTPIQLKVTGVIPDYCAGVLYRTGPGRYQVDKLDGTTAALDHWFDGLCQVHRFQILSSPKSSSETRVLYTSRYTVDALLDKIKKTGQLETFSFGQKVDPCETFFKKMTMAFEAIPSFHKERPGAHSIGVTLAMDMPGFVVPPDGPARYSGQRSLVAATDANMYGLLDAETLEPLKTTSQQTLHPALKGPLAATHTQFDPTTGDAFNYNLDFGYNGIYRVFRVSAATGKTTILATITDSPPAYIHSFFLTANHVVLCVWGSHMAYRGLKVLYHRNIIDSLSPLDASKPCRWYVIDRSPANLGVVATYISPAFFAFHTINAYEEPSSTEDGEVDIFADVACYPNLNILHRFYYANLLSSSPSAQEYMRANAARSDETKARITRFRLPDIFSRTKSEPAIPKEAITVSAAHVSQNIELPSINPRFAMRKHRFAYGATDKGRSTFFDGIGKFDSVTLQSKVWSRKGHTPSEAIFVGDPAATDGEEDEDRGVLLSVVLDGNEGRSYLLVLDARTMLEVGRAAMEIGVPFGFHGLHAPEAGVGVEKK